MRLVVYGSPAPQGSKKAVGRSKVGRTIIVESSEKVEPWRADVRSSALQYIEDFGSDFEPFDCALQLRLVFTFLRPKSTSRKRRPYPSVYPDLCKLARSTEDALSSAGVWRDDALVVAYRRLAKVYAGEDIEALDRPGCVVVIEPAPIPLFATLELSGGTPPEKLES